MCLVFAVYSGGEGVQFLLRLWKVDFGWRPFTGQQQSATSSSEIVLSLYEPLKSKLAIWPNQSGKAYQEVLWWRRPSTSMGKYKQLGSRTSWKPARFSEEVSNLIYIYIYIRFLYVLSFHSYGWNPRKYTAEFWAYVASILCALKTCDLENAARSPREVDPSLSDWELFKTYCLDEDFNLMGDPFDDVSLAGIHF